MWEEEYQEKQESAERPDVTSPFSFRFRQKRKNAKPQSGKKTTDAGKAKKENDSERKRLVKTRFRRKQKEAAETARKTETAFSQIVKKAQELWRKTAAVTALSSIGICLLVVLVLLLVLGFSIFSNVYTGVMEGSYQSDPAELDGADASLTRKELDLQKTIDNIETDHPSFDEYHYDLDPIGHDPFVLINYLSAKNGTFTAGGAEAEIADLFSQMYELTLTEREETRTRTVHNDETGDDEEEEYTVKILDVKLEATDLSSIVTGRLSGNALELYQTYGQTKGALQEFYTPLDMDWQGLISSYYGHRKNPRDNHDEFHRGVDIAVAEGTDVYAAQDGVVTFAGYDDEYGNYVVIENEKGYVSKYAHLSEINIPVGQTLKHGTLIGKTGSTGSVTGSHLHLECMYRGEYYNPLFYFENGVGALYGTTQPVGSGASAVLAEAQRYLGYPYVWGGSSPATSFDCSGFVCWSFTNSGAYSLPRTTAQGIYNRCLHISTSEARPGDLVFFKGTYQSGNPVTHVGIYCGDGKMIHAGSPIKISPITTPYWQSHLYGFGRLLN